MASRFRDRSYLPGDHLHVASRGLSKRRVFYSDDDIAAFLSDLANTLEATPVGSRPTLLAFAVLANHFHLVLRVGSDTLAVRRLIGALKRKHAARINSRAGTSGSIWQSPYRSRTITGAADLANTIAYVHLNPSAQNRLKHSSHGAYSGERPWWMVDHEAGLKAFGGQSAYHSYLEATASMRRRRTTLGQ
ncbi:MAG: transposase [Solirubrobacterales bacterium]